MDDAGQVAFAQVALDGGLRGEQGSAIEPLVQNRGDLVVPRIKAKMEEVLNSTQPAKCFTAAGVDPLAFLGQAADLIWYASERESLRQFSRLEKLDRQRFGLAPDSVFWRENSGGRNPFSLVYWALELGDADLDRTTSKWAEKALKEAYREYAGGPQSMKRRWATILADRYSGVPNQAQWRGDPLVSRLNAELSASLSNEVSRLAREEWDKNPRRIQSMSDADVAAVTKSRLDDIKHRLEQQTPLDRFDVVFALARSRSSTVMPVVRAAIEDAVALSPVSRSVESGAGRLIRAYTLVVTAAADEQALKIVARFAKLEEFQGTAIAILQFAKKRGSPFGLAYRALAFREPEIDKQVVLWAENLIASPPYNIPKDNRRLWAEAVAERYGGVPTDEQWRSDPIASRLSRETAEMARAEVERLAAKVAVRAR